MYKNRYANTKCWSACISNVDKLSSEHYIFDSVSHQIRNRLCTVSSQKDLNMVLPVDRCLWGRGNSTVVSVSVYQAGGPGLLPARSACHRKVEFYHCIIDSLPPVLTTGSKKAVHVLLCLCNNACKSSLAICRKSRALCPVSRLLSVPIWPACVKQGR